MKQRHLLLTAKILLGICLYCFSSPIGEASFVPDLTQSLTPSLTLKEPHLFFAGRTPEEKFAYALIEKHVIDPGKNCAGVYASVHLKPEELDYYDLLQERVAQRIPTENQRPIIDLTVTRSQGPSLVPCSIGILGGTGPLSDSVLLSKVMKHLASKSLSIPWDRFAINLLSAPPPRTTVQKILNLSYPKRLLAFATRGHDRYYLASNTAHLNIGGFRKAVTATALRPGINVKENSVVDLVDAVCQDVEKPLSEGPIGVLILGTKVAYDAELYPTYLARRSFQKASSAKASPYNHFYVLPTAEKAEELQTYIDMTKSGKAKEAGPKIMQLIREEVSKILQAGGTLNKIILGCTELPMALEAHLGPLSKISLEESKSSIEWIDTEEIFAQKIAQDVLELLSPSSDASNPLQIRSSL